MMCKSILVIVLVGLAAGATANPWKACGQNLASIKGVSLGGCNFFSTCNIRENSEISVYINYFLHEKIQRPIVRIENENGDYNEAPATISDFLGDNAKTTEGYRQIIESDLTAPANTVRTKSTVRFTVREHGTDVGNAPVCFELLVGPLNSRA